MNRLFLISGIAVFVAAIFLTPGALTLTSIQVAKASTVQCSASNSFGTTTQSKLGSCASSSFASEGVLSRGVIGGSQSSCKSNSVAQNSHTTFFSSQGFSSNGAVACSSSSP